MSNPLRYPEIALLLALAVAWTLPLWKWYLPGRLFDRLAYGRRKP